jgi:hypothetical protein
VDLNLTPDAEGLKIIFFGFTSFAFQQKDILHSLLKAFWQIVAKHGIQDKQGRLKVGCRQVWFEFAFRIS